MAYPEILQGYEAKAMLLREKVQILHSRLLRVGMAGGLKMSSAGTSLLLLYFLLSSSMPQTTEGNPGPV